MTFEELARLLENENVDPSVYWIEPVNAGRGRYEYVGVRAAGKAWQVYLNAQDTVSSLGLFATIDGACRALYVAIDEWGLRQRLVASFASREEAHGFVAKLNEAGIERYKMDAIVMARGRPPIHRVFVDDRDLHRAISIRDGR